jgi:hypothetical protein
MCPDNVRIEAEHFHDPLLTLLEKTYYFIRRVAFDNETSFSEGRRFSYCRSCVKAKKHLLLHNYGRLRAADNQDFVVSFAAQILGTNSQQELGERSSESFDPSPQGFLIACAPAQSS